MASPPLDASVLARLCEELQALPEVRQVVTGTDAIHLICERAEQRPMELHARAVAARHGFAANELSVQVSYLRPPEPSRRSRFVSAVLAHPTRGRARATVVLEWNEIRYEAAEEGESGAPTELRVTAQAAVRTLEQLLNGALKFQLVGIKSVTAFDASLVIALLRAADAPERSLVGVAIDMGDPPRAAALAVLNATNRVLGNYLSTPG